MKSNSKKSGLVLTGALVRGFAKVRHGKRGIKHMTPVQVISTAKRIIRQATAA